MNHQYICNIFLYSYAYVEFANVEGRDAALEMAGTEMGGRDLRIVVAEPRKEGHSMNSREPNGERPKSAASSTLFLGNLSFNVHEGSLRENFSEYGNIIRVSLPTDRETGRAKG